MLCGAAAPPGAAPLSSTLASVSPSVNSDGTPSSPACLWGSMNAQGEMALPTVRVTTSRGCHTYIVAVIRAVI